MQKSEMKKKEHMSTCKETCICKFEYPLYTIVLFINNIPLSYIVF